MSLIIVGDLHAKTKQPHRNAIREFLEWLLENYDEEDIIFLGDIFDSSSPHSEVEYEIINLISKFKRVYLISGNHDQSKIVGNTLVPHMVHDNIQVFTDKIIIQNIDHHCLCLPYKYNYKEYENIEGEFDFIFTHIVEQKVQFANEGIEFPKLKGTFIHGHTHIFKDREYIDNYGNKHIILGVPIPTRQGEDQVHKILKINENKTYEYIDVPNYFKYETINYGDEPANKNNILNIKNAPNRKLVYEKYKDCYIRDEGIELLRTENTKETFKQAFENSNILDKFKVYAQDKGLSKEVLECCSQRLSRII